MRKRFYRKKIFETSKQNLFKTLMFIHWMFFPKSSGMVVKVNKITTQCKHYSLSSSKSKATKASNRQNSFDGIGTIRFAKQKNNRSDRSFVDVENLHWTSSETCRQTFIQNIAIEFARLCYNGLWIFFTVVHFNKILSWRHPEKKLNSMKAFSY